MQVWKVVDQTGVDRICIAGEGRIERARLAGVLNGIVLQVRRVSAGCEEELICRWCMYRNGVQL